MKLRKLGLLAAFIALAASFAAIGYSAQPASAQAGATYVTSVVCTPGTIASSPCTATITLDAAITQPDTLTIQATDISATILGGGAFGFASAATRSGGSCAATVTNLQNTLFQQVLTVAPPAGGCARLTTIVLTFNIQATGPLGFQGVTPPTGGGPACFKVFGSVATGVVYLAGTIIATPNPPITGSGPPCATVSTDQTGRTLFTILGATNLIPVQNCAQPTGLVFAFSNAVTGAFPAAIPGQITSATSGSVLFSGASPQAYQILPNALVGTVTPVVTGGGNACAGVIEVSTVNGTLVDASGKLATNLRISCGDPVTFAFTGQGISPNTCNGVNFAVLGLGVGFTEIRARYQAGNFGLGNPGLNAPFYPCFGGVTGTGTAIIPGFQNTVNVITPGAASVPCILDREASTVVAFVAPVISVNLGLNPNPIVAGQNGVATARFNRNFQFCDINRVNFCVDPTTGQPLREQGGSTLNGTVIFTTDDPLIITFRFAQPNVATVNNQVPGSIAAAPSSTFPGGIQGGFQTTANQSVARCGFFPTLTSPYGGLPSGIGGTIPATLGTYFGGCDSVSVDARAVNPGVTNITATFIPDMPNAYQFNVVQAANLTPVVPGFLAGSNTSSIFARSAWEVVGVSATGDQALVRGCNNITPTIQTATEAISAFAARVNPSGILISIWEHQPATNTFRGYSPAPGAPNDLAAVTRLRPVFVCVSGPGTLSQPAA